MREVHEILEGIDKGLSIKIQERESGERIGVTSGFRKLDSVVGRIRKGSIWIVGGYSGTGKSFFVLNMIEGIIREAVGSESDQKYKTPRVMVFSTELSDTDYSERHILMRSRRYLKDLDDRDPQIAEEYKASKDKYMMERFLNPFIPVITGNVGSFEEIEEYVRKFKPDVFFIDYIQELTINKDGRTLIKEDETMSEISAALVRLVKETGSACVVISQINNYMVNVDSRSSRLSPFSFGKQIFQASDVSLLLDRKRKDGDLCSLLDVIIMKSRNGGYGTVSFKVGRGYFLEDISKEEANQIESLFLSKYR